MDFIKDYGSTPTDESQSYVLALLALGTVKRNIDVFSSVNTLSDEIQTKVIKLGVDLMKGEVDPEEYVKQYEKLCIEFLDKDKREGVKFDDYVKEQIKMRVFTSYGMSAKDRKKLKENMILKEAANYEPEIMKYVASHPHTSYNQILAHLGVDPKSGRAIPVYHATKKLLTGGQIQREKLGKSFLYSVKGTPAAPQPELPKQDATSTVAPSSQAKMSVEERDPAKVIALWGAGEAGLERARKELNHTKQIAFHTLPQTPEKAKEQGVEKKYKFVQKRLKDLVAQIQILKDNLGTASVAPVEQPIATPPVQVAPKADYKTTVLNLIDKHPHVTTGQVLADLGIAPGSPAQISVYKAMQDLLIAGAIKRTKEGKSFFYTKGDGTPVELTKTARTKYKSMQEVIAVVNKHWRWADWKQEDWTGSDTLTSESGDRGPRTDHGGGGDGWMDASQINRIAKPYIEKWGPRVKELEKALKKEKIIAKPEVEYGEKGHIGLYLQILEPTFKKK